MPSASAKLMTTADLLAMPDDGVERWLINGELREAGEMTKRSLGYSSIMSQIACHLVAWMKQSGAKGKVVSGEAGIRLRSDPDTTVGVDVAYLPLALLANQAGKSTIAEGVPPLVLEILSPSDKQEDFDEKIDIYLEAGAAHVWTVDPHDRAVLVHRPGQIPELFAGERLIDAEPQLPGFRAAVSAFFE